MSYRLRTDCRACGNTKLTEVFSLGFQPLANAFAKPDDWQSAYYPLAVNFCEVCTNAQLSVVVNPDILYHNYPYITSRSETMQKHFESLWSAIGEEGCGESVIEIGSNDGHFLNFCKDHGAHAVLGIDPAQNLKPDQSESGIISICGMFDEKSAGIAHIASPSPSVIIARHVFCHLDDWFGFIKNLDTLSTRDTLTVIEVPYAEDTLARVEWDTIYHEHLDYLSIKAMSSLLEHSTFRLHKVMRFPIHGGSIVLFLRRRDHANDPDKSVQEFLNSERITTDTWWSFSDKAHKRIKHLSGLVKYALGKSKIVFYGASAKSSVWISACGFNHHNIKFIVDDTPQKQGKCSPGTRIPIVPESELTITKADYAILGAWNFAAEIEAKNKKWIADGGVFLNPHDPCHITD